MIIKKKKYDKLTPEQLKDVRYWNPCVVVKKDGTISKNKLRVGEVFDNYLGCWRQANKSDF